MHIEIDKYAHIHSPIHKWDERYKITSLTLLVIGFSLIQNLILLPLILIIAFVLAYFSKIPTIFIITRLKIPLVFFGMVFVFLPVTSGGDIFFSLGFINIYTQGLKLATIITVRGFAILIVMIVMFGSSRFDRSMRALHQLKVPEVIINIILFTYRYIFLYLENLRKMKMALTLRGYQNNSTMKSIKTSAGVIVNLFIRSYDQTERIYNAMILRGYEGKLYSHFIFKTKQSDIIFSIIVLCITLILIGLQIIL